MTLMSERFHGFRGISHSHFMRIQKSIPFRNKTTIIRNHTSFDFKNCFIRLQPISMRDTFFNGTTDLASLRSIALLCVTINFSNLDDDLVEPWGSE